MVTVRYYVTVITVILGGSAQFYSYGIVNPSQTLLTQWINETYTERYGTPVSLTLSNLLWSFVVSSIAIGAILGASLTRIVGEKCGRRNGLLANGVVNVMAAFLELISRSASSPELLIFGRIIFGINMGLTSGLVPMYLMEITPAKYRGKAGTLHQIAVAFSDWFSLLIGLPGVLGGSELWPLAFAFPGLPALALCCILPFCPESPKYTLVTKGNRTQARRDVELLVGPIKAKVVFEDLIREIAADNRTAVGGFKELFTRKDLRVPLAVSILVMIAQQFTACTAVFAYSTDMFLNANLPFEVAQYSTLAIGVIYFFFACSSPFLIDKIGRRPLSLFQLCSCCAALTCLSLFTFLQNTFQFRWASYGTIAALLVYMCVYGVGSPIPWMITSELFTQQMRSTAVTVSVFVAWTFAFIVSTAYLPLQQMVGVSLSYVPFIVGLVVCIIFLYILLPETKDRKVSEIVDEARQRTRSLSTGKIWEANARARKPEMQLLLDRIDSRDYSSTDSILIV